MGRPKGSPNKASKEWKELCRDICKDPAQQKRLREACLDRPELLVKLAEFAYGKPRQSGDWNVNTVMVLPGNADIADTDDEDPEA